MGWKRVSSVMLAVSFASAAPTALQTFRNLGRVNPNTSEWSWPATGISFNFTGTAATVTFSHYTGTNSLAWIIDNQSPIIIPQVNSTAVSTPPLSSGRHTVSLLKRSEALFGSLFFASLGVTGGTPESAKPAARHIEFIGDSITVGYGEDGTLPCTNTAALEDAPNTYGAMTARNLSADYDLVAWSGIGLVRNYVSATPDSSQVMPERWTRYGANDADGSYTFPSDRVPQAVVINLGTNDYGYMLYGADGQPYNARQPLNSTVYAQAYTAFVKQVLGKYPKTQVFLCSSPQLGDYWPPGGEKQHTSQLNALKSVAQAVGPSVHVVDFETQVVGEGLSGCDDHPGPSGHAAMAEVLIPAIKTVMAW